MIEQNPEKLSIDVRCNLVSISRSSYYYKCKGESAKNLSLMRMIDAQFLETPYYGSRQMVRHFARHDQKVSRVKMRRLMRKLGLQAVYQAPKTSTPHPSHKIYPYLLRDKSIKHSNQVWCSDITYIPLQHGFLYLVAPPELSKELFYQFPGVDSRFCVEALQEAIEKYGSPGMFNTDQGSQFTSFEFTNTLKDTGIKISMDGRGRWMDNVFIERLWRSLKYECVYLNAFETGTEVRNGIGKWIKHYNETRPHSTFDGQTPSEVYNQSTKDSMAA